MKQQKGKREEETSDAPRASEGGSAFFMPATNLACHIGDVPGLISTRAYGEPFAPACRKRRTSITEYGSGCKMVSRHTLDAPRHKSLIFTRRWRCRGCVRGSRCHGANKYGPIDRRAREEEEEKKRARPARRSGKCWPSGATRAHRPRRTINTPRTISRIIKE